MNSKTLGSPLAIITWFLAVAASILGTACSAADPAASKEGDAVLGHLNATLAWYHQIQTTDGWSIQPSDEFYRGNQHDLTNQAVADAFESAYASAAEISYEGKPATKNAAGDSRTQRIEARAATNAERVEDLKEQLSSVEARIPAAVDPERGLLVAQKEVIQAQIDQATTLGDTLNKALALFSLSDEAGDGESLTGRIAALKKTVPEISDSHAAAAVKRQAATPVSTSNSDGLFSRGETLFSLLRYRHSIDGFVTRTTELLASTDSAAEAIGAKLRDTLKPSDDDSQRASKITDAEQLGRLRAKIEASTEEFKSQSASLLPLRQQSMALQHSRENLIEWRGSIISQSDLILKTLLTRAIGLAVVLAILVIVSEGWRRATFRYVHDARRRRQFLLIRRFATTILMIVVLVMGFVSDFSSFATFAGFITAGIAVALQTIILSVAAYFFLIGRYGVRVGDRVTVSGVTGDVIDIGLVRVFLMELAGTGIDLHPTGRVVVLANSSLFSTSPLYKQLPGTDYAWHEIFVMMAADVDPAPAQHLLLTAVNNVYGGYRQAIESQHVALERLLDFKTELPVPSAHVRLSDSGIELVIRFPAEIRRMSEIDEAVSKEVLAAIRADEAIRKTTTSMPRIRSAVKS